LPFSAQIGHGGENGGFEIIGITAIPMGEKVLLE
jgi:hypothetical protein